MSEEITTQPGDMIKITAGDFKGEKGKIIGVYNNSSSVELDIKEADDKPRKTVIAHKNYKVIK
ncbi:hypothetical protein BKP45_14320 [Anaerobacillus alkalidiazotrophicus]|uniref:KOW domain-containing protein n=2 Tax=Anaerobacillus TaxID=704093 RepID=A0A1S2M3N8_9BACI|nr:MULTISPECIES: DUF2187 family protein [Anaerobacillus]OIJ11225.1 hypothetical protein BKP37_16380 [Anaerobacillus alkalilacustris]OIJ19140.1 hypothetical protein BKP45_14320 [Anaerobacillus alkalidiazotrophicus]